MQTKPLLWTSAILLFIGFIIAPVIQLLHVSQEVGQFLAGLNFLCGGLAFFVIAAIKGEV